MTSRCLRLFPSGTWLIMTNVISIRLSSAFFDVFGVLEGHWQADHLKNPTGSLHHTNKRDPSHFPRGHGREHPSSLSE